MVEYQLDWMKTIHQGYFFCSSRKFSLYPSTYKCINKGKLNLHCTVLSEFTCTCKCINQGKLHLQCALKSMLGTCLLKNKQEFLRENMNSKYFLLFIISFALLLILSKFVVHFTFFNYYLDKNHWWKYWLNNHGCRILKWCSEFQFLFSFYRVAPKEWPPYKMSMKAFFEYFQLFLSVNLMQINYFLSILN